MLLMRSFIGGIKNETQQLYNQPDTSSKKMEQHMKLKKKL
jgi:hypothetical protein